MDSTIVNLVASLVFGFGVFFLFMAFVIPPTFGRQIVDKEGRTTIASFGEGDLINTILADISALIRKEPGDLMTKLRRSNWVYKSPIEYHARRMISALAVGGLAIFIVYMFPEVGPLAVPLFIGGAIYGFLDPDRQIDGAIRKRRERLETDMAFGVEKISILMKTVSAEIAMSRCQEMGEFGAIASRLSKEITVSKQVDKIIDEIMLEFPESPKLRSFLKLIQKANSKGMDLRGPLMQMSQQIRGGLRDRLISEGKKADVQISLITSMVILFAILLVTIAPMAMMFNF